jgi:hypothetical protein
MADAVAALRTRARQITPKSAVLRAALQIGLDTLQSNPAISIAPRC